MEQLHEMSTARCSVKPMSPSSATTHGFHYPVTRRVHPFLTWDTPTDEGNYPKLLAGNQYLNTLPDVPFRCMNTQGNNWCEYTTSARRKRSSRKRTSSGCGGNYLSDIPIHGQSRRRSTANFAGNERYKTLEPLLADEAVREVAVLHIRLIGSNHIEPKPSWNLHPPYHSVAVGQALVELHWKPASSTVMCARNAQGLSGVILSDSASEHGETAKRRNRKKRRRALSTHETARATREQQTPEFMLGTCTGHVNRGSCERGIW